MLEQLLIPGLIAASQAPLPVPVLATHSVVKVLGTGTCDGNRQGSGVIVAPGVVATNAHVAGEAATITIFKDGQSWPAHLKQLAPDMDLCLLWVPGLPYPAAQRAAPEQLAEGTDVVSVGYPGGQGPRVQSGRITHLWSYCGARLIQSDARTSRGSSGGGLFSLDGRLVGITTFLFETYGDMNFSVPVTWVDTLLQRAFGFPAPLPPPCRPLDLVRRDFLGNMTVDPSNWPAWETFTRTWVETHPADANAWTALSYALYHKLNDQVAHGTLLDQKLLLESASTARRALQLDPHHAKAWNNLGVMLDLENRFEEAEKAYVEATSQDPSYAMAWLNLGCTRFNAGRFGSARHALQRTLALQSDQPRAWALLSTCEARLHLWQEAATHMETALRYRPFHAPWWLELAEARFLAGSEDGYRAALERLDALDPELAKRAPRQKAPASSGK